MNSQKSERDPLLVFWRALTGLPMRASFPDRADVPIKDVRFGHVLRDYLVSHAFQQKADSTRNEERPLPVVSQPPTAPHAYSQLLDGA